jgi:hypothetical protein
LPTETFFVLACPIKFAIYTPTTTATAPPFTYERITWAHSNA